MKVKECTSTKCRAKHRVCPSEEGNFFLFFSLVLLYKCSCFCWNIGCVLMFCWGKWSTTQFGLEKTFSLQTVAVNLSVSQLVVLPAFLSYSILGLFNICDKILHVAIDIILEWHELFKRGCPISSFIVAKSEQLLLKLNKVIIKFP